MEESTGDPKVVVTVFGSKGEGKSSCALGFPGKVYAVSMDGKTIRVKRGLYKDDPRLIVLDGTRYYDFDPVRFVAAGKRTHEFVLFLLGEVAKKGDADWVVVDGMERVHQACVSDDTMVYTPSGPVRAGEYDGQEIMSWDFNHDCAVYDRPLAFSRRNVGQLVRLTTSMGNLEVTRDHPLFSKVNATSWRSMDWREAQLIRPTNGLARPISCPVEPSESSRWMTKPLAKMLGYMVAEGHNKGRSSPTFTNTDPQICDDFAQAVAVQYPELDVVRDKILTDYGSVRRAAWHLRPVRRGSKAGLENPFTADLKKLGLWGCGSHEKFIPRDVLLAEAQSLASFLQGYYAGDGWSARPKDRWSYRYDCFTVSKRLADDLSFALWRFGCQPKIYLTQFDGRGPREKAKGGKKRISSGYQLHIGNPVLSWNFEQNILWQRTKKRPAGFSGTHRGMYFENVRGVQPVPGKRVVCNFTMPRGNFVANGFITHNCESVMRQKHNLGAFQGFSELTWWKERRLALRQVFAAALGAAKRGAIFVTYSEKEDLFVESGQTVQRKQRPKWLDVIEEGTDVVLRVWSEREEARGLRFKCEVTSSKFDEEWPTGARLDVTHRTLGEAVDEWKEKRQEAPAGKRGGGWASE